YNTRSKNSTIFLPPGTADTNMKKLQHSIGASALQITLSIALLFSFAILLASSMKATGPAAQNRPEPAVVAQGGFYPALPDAVNGATPTCTPIEVDDKITTGYPKQLGTFVPSGIPSTCGN